MKTLLLLTTIVSALASCDTVTISNTRLLSLYRQRIPDSKYVMYEFTIAGHMAFDGENQSHAILDSSEEFSSDKIDQINADLTYGRLKLDSLQMIGLFSPGDRPILEQDTLMTPIKEYIKTYNGVPIRILEYQQTYGTPVNWTSGGNEYKFDSFNETKDSLFFYGIKKKDDYGVDLPATQGFIKGNIKVIDSSQGQIDHIEIKQFIIKRGKVYKPGGRDSILKNKPIVDMIEYDFFPVISTSASSFSDTGIYKRLK